MSLATPDIFTEYELSVEFSPACEHSEHDISKFHADSDAPLWEVIVWCRYCGMTGRVLFCDHWVQYFQSHPQMRLTCAGTDCHKTMTADESYLVVGTV